MPTGAITLHDLGIGLLVLICCVSAIGHHKSQPSSSAAGTDDDCGQISNERRDEQQDDEPVNMTCRRWSDDACSTVTSSPQHRASPASPLPHRAASPPSPTVSPPSAAAPRIWSVVELIQSSDDTNINLDQRRSSDTDLVRP